MTIYLKMLIKFLISYPWWRHSSKNLVLTIIVEELVWQDYEGWPREMTLNYSGKNSSKPKLILNLLQNLSQSTCPKSLYDASPLWPYTKLYYLCFTFYDNNTYLYKCHIGVKKRWRNKIFIINLQIKWPNILLLPLKPKDKGEIIGFYSKALRICSPQFLAQERKIHGKHFQTSPISDFLLNATCRAYKIHRRKIHKL